MILTVSLNEVEATAKKAARGAGFTWGMAEEAAKATRWLCGNGVDGCAELSRLLSIKERNIERTPIREAGVWEAASGPLCPINVGACMADQAHELSAEGWQVNDVACPAFLMPFAADIAVKAGKTVAMVGQEFTLVTDGNHQHLTGKVPSHDVSVVIRPTQKTVLPSGGFTRVTSTEADWAVLQTLAYRTYAPATEESRMTGAGAGITDND